MPIYDDVVGGSGQAPTPGIEAATAIDAPEEAGALPVAPLEDPAAGDGTTTTTVYEQAQTSFPSPENPRQADHVSDVAGPAGKVVRMAQSFVGTPYVWGGSSPSGFDCSGFVQYVYRKIGVDLPRISADQARAGARIGVGKLQVGDLVAWDNSTRNNGADHIAIYIGGGRIAEAPRPGVPLRIRKLGNNEGAWGVRVL